MAIEYNNQPITNVYYNDGTVYSNENSVLGTIKTMIGPSETYEGFDLDLTTHINSILMYLVDIGAVKKGTRITSDHETWNQILEGNKNIEGIKSLIYIRCRLMFDPPANATMVKTLQDEANRLEFYILMECDK